MMSNIYLFVMIALWIVLLSFMNIQNLRSVRKWRGIWRRLGMPVIEDQIETALADFVIAYEEQEQEQLLDAYHQAGDVLEKVRKGKVI